MYRSRLQRVGVPRLCLWIAWHSAWVSRTTTTTAAAAAAGAGAAAATTTQATRQKCVHTHSPGWTHGTGRTHSATRKMDTQYGHARRTHSATSQRFGLSHGSRLPGVVWEWCRGVLNGVTGPRCCVGVVWDGFEWGYGSWVLFWGGFGWLRIWCRLPGVILGWRWMVVNGVAAPNGAVWGSMALR